MKVYIVFLFDKNNYPSTNEYVCIFSTKEKAEKYVKNNAKKYDRFQELYLKEECVL